MPIHKLRPAILFILLFTACGGSEPELTLTSGTAAADATLRDALRSYTVEFLRRNPTTNTYLGGAGLDPSLKVADGLLRDHSPVALQEEDAWLARTRTALEGMPPTGLSEAPRIDREVALAQIAFLLRQHQVRRYQERALDTYVVEPFRAIDWQLQGLSKTGDNSYGTADEWALVVNRLQRVPAFLATAREQLLVGVAMRNTPDGRMLLRDGIESSEANAAYFSKVLPSLAASRMSGPERDRLLGEVRSASQSASAAYLGMRNFVASTFFEDRSATQLKAQFRDDRFAMGAAEYDWALKNNFRIEQSASQLYDGAWPIVLATQREMVALAQQIARSKGWTLPAEGGGSAVRAVFDHLSVDYPKSDTEMVAWYREAAQRLVDYGRRTGIFDVPADYKLDVVETPPPLQASIDGAAYYPAPPFKNSGVGRFYVTPTHNDPEGLKTNNRAALADLAAHEGFPGHDWYYKLLTQYRDQVSPVRWLTPGAVEDSSAMWEDSMPAEGWGLYAEALMAEPQLEAPDGFYTPEERLYQLQGKLYRDLRVRIDPGIHTGRLSYGEAVTLFSETVDFLPGSCEAASVKTPAKRASCAAAERAIFRYSKWPTQAVTYRLGKDQIYGLRAAAEAKLGKEFSPKGFHQQFIRQGTIPSGYFRDSLLRDMQEAR